jgi:hypothetical protein
MGADHLGFGPGLVDEDEHGGVKPGLGRFPVLPRLCHVRPGLLGGVQTSLHSIHRFFRRHRISFLGLSLF